MVLGSKLVLNICDVYAIMIFKIVITFEMNLIKMGTNGII
jgi:hypothetical protein